MGPQNDPWFLKILDFKQNLLTKEQESNVIDNPKVKFTLQAQGPIWLTLLHMVNSCIKSNIPTLLDRGDPPEFIPNVLLLLFF